MKKKKTIILLCAVLVVALAVVWFVSRPSIKNKSVYYCEHSETHEIFYETIHYSINNVGKLGSSRYSRKLNGNYSIVGDENIPVVVMGNQIKLGSGQNEMMCNLVDVYKDKNYAEIQNDILQEIINTLEQEIVYYEENPDKITLSEAKGGGYMTSIDVIKSQITRIRNTMEDSLKESR